MLSADDYDGVLNKDSQDLKLTSLKRTNGESHVNVYAVVTACYPPSKSKGTDYKSTLKLWDPSLGSINESLSINVFRPSPDLLPQVPIGSIIFFSPAKVSFFNGRTQLASFPGNKHEICYDNRVFHKQNQVIEYILKRYKAGTAGKVQFQPKLVGRPMFKLKDIKQPNKFFDLVCQVVTVSIDYQKIDLTVTDYTRNDLLRNKNEINPSIHTMSVCLWDEHAKRAERIDIKPGMFVILRNLRSRLVNEELVAVLHSDQRAPDKTSIVELEQDDEDLRDLLKQKEAWSIEFGPPADILDENISELTISEALNAEKPLKFKLKAYIRDYFPQDLKDYSSLYCNSCKKSFKSAVKPLEKCEFCATSLNFNFRFSWLLYDGTGTLGLLVDGQDATTLLGMQPANLFTDDKALKMLEQKLSKLWTIQPSQGCPLSNPRPFTCCIEGYWAEDESEERFAQYRLFNTVLK